MPRPLITLVLRPEPGIDGLRALRAALRTLLRRHGLRCTAIRCDALDLQPAPERRVADVVAHATDVATDG